MRRDHREAKHGAPREGTGARQGEARQREDTYALRIISPADTIFGRAAGWAKLTELRAAGKDPSKGGQVAKRRAAKLVQRMNDQAAWEAEHGTEADPMVFEQETLPHLQGITVRTMAKATGLSELYCSLIRRGRHVPHERHWETLARLSEYQSDPVNTRSNE